MKDPGLLQWSVTSNTTIRDSRAKGAGTGVAHTEAVPRREGWGLSHRRGLFPTGKD